MHSLPEIQHAFLRGLFAGDAVSAPALFRANGVDGDQRFDIYRNNVLSNYRQALRDTYPAIVQIVGEAFFDHMATQCARSIPATSGDLGEYGEAFVDFVATFPGAESLPYLRDTARLEWALDESFHAAESPPFEPQALADIPPERQGELRFMLHPSARLIASPYPILAIWSLARGLDATEDPVDLDAGGDRLLVLRAGDFQPRLHPLGAGAFAFLEALGAGATLAAAFTAATDVEPAFDLQAVFAQHIALGTFACVALEAI